MNRPSRSIDHYTHPDKLTATVDGIEHNFVKASYTPARDMGRGPDDIAITAGGLITLGRQFIKAHNVVENTRVHLYWDDERQLIALAFTSEPAPSAYPVHLLPTSGRIPAGKFFKWHLPKNNPAPYVGRYRCDVRGAKDAGIVDFNGEVCIIDLGKRIGSSVNSPARRESATASADTVRIWATKHGYQVGERGRLPREVIVAYQSAHDQALSA